MPNFRTWACARLSKIAKPVLRISSATRRTRSCPTAGVNGHTTPLSTTASPLVSVVTPVYNGERYLAECIESVLAQTYQNWEYIIVNNCSTDRTREIGESYGRKDERIRIHNNRQL